jgi:hypothetical protein
MIMKTQKKQKRIHPFFKPHIKNFCKKERSVRDEEEQCTGKNIKNCPGTPSVSHPASTSLKKKPCRSRSP